MFPRTPVGSGNGSTLGRTEAWPPSSVSCHAGYLSEIVAAWTTYPCPMSSKSKSPKDDRRARAEQLKAEREAAARASERRTRLLIAIAVLAAIALVAVAVLATRSSTGENAAVPAGVTAPDGPAAYGDEGAPVVMDEWVDFACPACKTFNDSLAPTINQLVEDGELRVLYHPLSFLGPGSVRAANAFGCAADQGLTHEYYDALFTLQGTSSDPFTEENLIALGAEIGIENDEFATCVNEGTFNGWVDNVAASQLDNGVTGTPTIFLNGELVDLPDFSPESLLAAIDAAQAGGVQDGTDEGTDQGATDDPTDEGADQE
jgi:protein-disulfide isomerase